jgi:hypothetical protein
MSKVWSILKSPRTVNFVKLLIATVGVIHAIDEFKSASPAKKKIGFQPENEEGGLF